MSERCATSSRLSADFERVKTVFVQIVCISGHSIVIMETSTGDIGTLYGGRSCAIIVEIGIGR